MRIDWSLLLTIFLAIIVARIVEQALFSEGGTGLSTKVTAEAHSSAKAVVIYKNPIDQYIAEHYPNARR